MRPKPKVNKARLYSLRRQGFTVKEIVAILGISDGAVKEALHQGKFPGRVPLQSEFPPEKAREAARMRKQGFSLRAIGEAIGYSHEKVRTVLGEAKEAPRRPSRPYRLCSISGCENRHFGKGYCSVHYNRSKNGILDESGKVIAKWRICRICRRVFIAPWNPAVEKFRTCSRCRKAEGRK